MKQMKMNKWTVVLATSGLVSVASVANAQSSGATTNHDGFFTRFEKAMREQLGQPAFSPPDTNAPPATNAPPVQRRGLPTPFDSPPYPTGEWQIGGTPIIGDPNAIPTYPLMQALDGSPSFGDALQKSKINFYGWEDFSGNISSSHNTSTPLNNFPEIYDERANRMEQNQFVFYAERDPDEFQKDHIDWGFRYSVVYGLDYRYMISRGFLSDQLLKKSPGVLGQAPGDFGNFYGVDMPMMYGDIYIPYIAQGMNVRIGRIISEADIEAQLAPNNLMSSHSLLYGFDPYCQWGVFTTTKLNDCWIVQAGIAAGNDVTPWQKDPGTQPTGTVMVQWQSRNGHLSFYGGANAFNNGNFGYNNLQQYVGTWTYKFNDKLWTSQETWYMYMKNASSVPTQAVAYQNGSFPTFPGTQTTGYAPEWATLNYTMYRLGPSTFATLRNEYFDDFVGSRTGFANCYTEHSIGLTWWPDKLITIRPELRFDHSINKLVFNNATRANQFTASFDVVYHF
jgi:hypothetical protein